MVVDEWVDAGVAVSEGPEKNTQKTVSGAFWRSIDGAVEQIQLRRQPRDGEQHHYQDQQTTGLTLFDV